MNPSEIVHYSSPPSSGTLHVVRPTRPRKAWGVIQTFLQQVESLKGPSNIRLHVYGAAMNDDRELAASCLARAVSRFGPYKAITGRIVSWETQEVSGECHEWEVPAERFEEFRDYVIAGEPWHKQVLGPVTLRFSYQFQWRDPDGSGPLAAQLSGNCTPDGQLSNTLDITLGRRTRATPSLSFPYAHDDPRLVDLLSFVVPILPFKVAARYFYRGVPKKEGDSYVARKFDASGLISSLSGGT